MKAKDAFLKAFKDDKILGGLWSSIAGKSSAEEQADALARQASDLSKHRLQLAEDTKAENTGTVDDLIRSIYGEDTNSWNDRLTTETKKAALDRYFAQQRAGGMNWTPEQEKAARAEAMQNGWDWFTKHGVSTNAEDTQRALGVVGPRPTDENQSATLPKLLSAFEDADQSNYDALAQGLADVKNPDLIRSVQDLESKVKLSDQTKAAQTDALNKLKANTSVQETGEEKLMRLLARQKMESEMKGERDAMNASLKNRGAYGSGAELASQLQNQQNLATQRQISELGAQANAQQRAMQALGQYQQLGTALGNQDIALGKAQDTIGMFNNQVRQGYDIADVQNKQRNADRDVDKQKTLAKGRSDIVNNARGDTKFDIDTKTGLAGMRIGANSSGANAVSGAIGQQIGQLGNEAGYKLENDPTLSGYGL